MDIPVEVKSLSSAEYEAMRAKGPHGAETGPAMYTFKPGENGAPPSVEIFVNDGMKGADLPRVLGHEFEEVADIASQHLTSPEDIKAQTEAKLFQPNAAATTGEATAHDRAQARELARYLDQRTWSAMLPAPSAGHGSTSANVYEPRSSSGMTRLP